MSSAVKGPGGFDEKLALECAVTFGRSTQLGCTVSDIHGRVLLEEGYGCVSCGLCEALRAEDAQCARWQLYGMMEAERFGGKYIYFCPMGLTCFVSPILGAQGSMAKITVGPFLMVEREDYIAFDLLDQRGLTLPLPGPVQETLDKIPYVPAEKVHNLSSLLFMAVGFLNNVSEANRMLETQTSGHIQGQIGAYIQELKQGEQPAGYPFELENELMAAISQADEVRAQALLNELLGHILFFSGGDLRRIKTRIYELLVIMSRTAVAAGSPPEQSFALNHDFFTRALAIHDIDELCFLITDVMNRFAKTIFRFADIRHMDVVHKAVQYAQTQYAQRITLEDVARYVYLSPSYFSKIFKQEMGVSFNTWLNRHRIEKSKQLMHTDARLADIAGMVGFEDQSYFSKVFKRVTGATPKRFREKMGRIH